MLCSTARQVVQTPIGWVLPRLRDPDGHEMRFYVSDHASLRTHAQQPRRMHEAGTASAWSEPVPHIDLGLPSVDR
jgi:hypothetical protein